MNKKGGEKWLSIWWFFVLGVIGGAIVIGVLIYYSARIEVKSLEAEILTDRVLRCISDGSYLNEDFLSPSFDIFSECSINKDQFGPGSLYYLEISAKDLDGNSKRPEITAGDFSLKSDCEIAQAVTAEKYAKCVKRDELVFYSKEGKLEKIRINIISASNQEIKKVGII